MLVTGRDADRPGNSGSGVARLLVSPFVIIDHVRAERAMSLDHDEGHFERTGADDRSK